MGATSKLRQCHIAKRSLTKKDTKVVFFKFNKRIKCWPVETYVYHSMYSPKQQQHLNVETNTKLHFLYFTYMSSWRNYAARYRCCGDIMNSPTSQPTKQFFFSDKTHQTDPSEKKKKKSCGLTCPPYGNGAKGTWLILGG